ncbi:hypothetical protein NPX13_g10119 [Xylaria arbuscula]|uniref:Uncharacterized protein n=1 Tax=Xylaria arbuscula TaxID=114810 RepID=A0A9W8N550_9PEZI|nr:hypothetical protein NPX13_g10119 [Xylaria arbuscula]
MTNAGGATTAKEGVGTGCCVAQWQWCTVGPQESGQAKLAWGGDREAKTVDTARPRPPVLSGYLPTASADSALVYGVGSR